MTEPFDPEDALFEAEEKVDEETEAMEATTALLVFEEEGFWGRE